MFSLEVDVDNEAKDMLIAELAEQGSAGIVETDLPGGRCLLRAFFENEADADGLQRRFAARIERHAPRDWVEFSRQGWEPICVGSRFYLVPDWLPDAAPPGRLRIAINPGMACGTGYHEATQLCLEAMEEFVRPGMTVLDVGVGAGILSIAATLLGADRVIGCDVDPVAVDIAGAAGVEVFTGSANAIRAGSVDLIVANISAAAAIELAPEFVRCLAPEGRCIASGFENWDATLVAAAMEGAGAVVESKVSRGQWSAVIAAATLDLPY